MNPKQISFSQALQEILLLTKPLGVSVTTLIQASHFFSALDVDAVVDSPTADTSLKDGYAVRSEEITAARPDCPVHLQITGAVAAGAKETLRVEAGTAVRVLTGARIPPGATAVVSQEFTRQDGSSLQVIADSSPGRNILSKATDLAAGDTILRKGDFLTPGIIGLLAAGGISHVSVVRKPDLAVVSTGDEVMAPGVPLQNGQLYASNLAVMTAWCQNRGIQVFPKIIRDEKEAVVDCLMTAATTRDAVVTSGGSWTGERDLIVKTLQRLGWKQVFHGVRMGPGKGSGFGFLSGTPIFVLPGGPSANWIAFLKLVTPALRKMAGSRDPLAAEVSAVLQAPVKGRGGWTRFVLGDLAQRDGETVFYPHAGGSRLKSVASATAILTLPETERHLPAGGRVTVSLMD